MRELPEPDSYTWGANEPNVFTPGLVKAIQKQAYEDGLRDAADYLENEGDAVAGQCLDPYRLAKEVRAMLTASQKEAP